MGLLTRPELTTYPTGRRRRLLLGLAVLANMIGAYEAQIAPVLPLLTRDLDMSLTTYGAISAVAAIAGAFVSVAAGRATDRYGRVRLLVPLMLLTTLCCLGMTLVHSPRDLLVARIVLACVDGAALAATAPLVRDFSPRLGRAQAFSLWTWGPVGANFLAAAIAGLTLPLLHNSWRSQFVIMAAVSLVASLCVAGTLTDLSPELRARVVTADDTAADSDKSAGATAATAPRLSTLLRHPRIWAHIVGIALWLVLYLTLTVYGQVALTDSAGLSAAQASSVLAAFWLVQLVTLLLVGRLSDRLQLRKPFCLGGTAAAVLISGYLVASLGRPTPAPSALMITGALLGAALAVAYAPWMANFSENVEDIDPRLQGSAWGLFGFVSKAIAVAVLVLAPLVVGSGGDWRGWFGIAAASMVLFLPAIAVFQGPWRRAAPAALVPIRADGLSTAP